MKKKIITTIIAATFLLCRANAQTNTFPSTGNVGIGTTSPSQKLHVAGKIYATSDVITDGYNFMRFPLNSGGGFVGQDLTSGSNLMQMGFNAQGQYGGTLGTLSGNQFFVYNFQGTGWNGTYDDNYYWGFNNTGDNFWGSTNNHYSVKVQQPNSANTPLTIRGQDDQTANLFNIGNEFEGPASIFTVLANENVGIGTSTPAAKLDVAGNIYSSGKVMIGVASPSIDLLTNYSLAVNGSALFTKAVVKLNSSWPDYVFSKNYELPTLASVEKFINENSHLPGVASAQEVEKNGVDLGDNQAVLLKKVEELTLYMIELSKEVAELKKENKEIKAKQKN